MNLTQIMPPTCVKVPLVGSDKNSIITEMIDVLHSNGQLLDRQVALDAVLNREKTRSTGIGSGIAIPHGKCKAVRQLVMALGIMYPNRSTSIAWTTSRSLSSSYSFRR